jgi:uncharacterized membrane protein (UPF0136 family)
MSIRTFLNWLSFVLFIAGMAFSIVGGIWYNDSAWIAAYLAITGLVIGLIYAFSAKDIKNLLLASIALLVMAAAFSPITYWNIGEKLGYIMVDFAALVAPIAIISALKALILLGLERET